MAKKNTVEIILSAKDKASKVTQRAFSSVKESASTAISTIGKSVAVVATAAATLSGVVSKVGVGYNAMKEQSAIAWETILKSQEDAKKTLEELQVLGAKTPFEFEGLDKAGKLLTMAQLGGDKLKSSLTAVGDAVSAIGGNQETLEGVSMALFQMQAKGKVQAEEMMQLAERGLPVWDLLAEKMKKTPAQLMEMATKGELLAKDTVPLLVEAFGDRFGGAMEKQSSTFNGLMSTMKDNAKILSGVLTEGLFERIKGYLPPIIDLMERFTDAFQTGGIKGVMEEFLPPGVVDAITNGLNMVKDGFNTLKEVFIQNKNRIGEVINGLADYFEFLKNYWLGWVDFIKSLFNGEGNIGESFVRIFNVVKEVAVPILQDAMTFIQGIIAKLTQFWKENGDQIVEAVKNAFSFIASIIEFVMPIIKFIIEGVWGAIKNIFNGALNIIMGLIKTFAGLFTGDWSKMWEGIKQLFSGAIEFVWGLMQLGFLGRIFKIIKGFGGKATDVVTDIAGKFKGKFDDIVSSAKSKFEAVRDAIMTPINKAKDTVLGFVDDIKKAFANFGAKIKLPHFSISNASLNPVDWIKNGLPKLNVDWYDKGGVFYGPQIIGVGEKRPEFVGALDDLRKIVREETGSKEGNTYNITVNGNNVDITEERLVRTLQKVELLYG